MREEQAAFHSEALPLLRRIADRMPGPSTRLHTRQSPLLIQPAPPFGAIPLVERQASSGSATSQRGRPVEKKASKEPENEPMAVDNQEVPEEKNDEGPTEKVGNEEDQGAGEDEKDEEVRDASGSEDKEV